MLYQVRLQYGFMLEASSRDEAFQKALRRLRESPESAVSDVHQAGQHRHKDGLFKRLVTGR